MSTSTVSVYDQFDFLPDVTYDAIVASGNIVQPIFEWLQVPAGLTRATLTQVGAGLGDHASGIAHLTQRVRQLDHRRSHGPIHQLDDEPNYVKCGGRQGRRAAQSG